MKVLVVGSGGREHAIVWKLLQSPGVAKVYAAPGNGGTAGMDRCVNLDLEGRDTTEEETQEALIRYAVQEKINLAVVGPEGPLAADIAGRFRKAGIVAAGPDAKAAALESSKAWAKSFMETYGVRTASSHTYTDAAKAKEQVRRHFAGTKSPLVIKADGLASGKGVVIASARAEAESVIASFMEGGALGGAGKTIVLEEFLEGREVSVLAAVSVSGKGGQILPFIPARDHKRRFDNDEGPNTGGMGAAAPVVDFSAVAREDFRTAILEPTLKGLRAAGIEYRGFLFFGLMVHENRCSLLEYNARLGDPETQALLPLMKSDFSELCFAAALGTLEKFNLEWKSGAVCAPVAVAAGYPGTCRTGDPVAFNETSFEKTGALLFAAGVVRGAGGPAGSGLRTTGGRVLSVAAYGRDAAQAREKAYLALEAVSFEGMDYRRDIGAV